MPPDPPTYSWLDPLVPEAREALAAALRAKIDGVQGGTGTFADHVLLDVIAGLRQAHEEPAWEEGVARLRAVVARLAQGRFVDYATRLRGPAGAHGASDIEYFDLVMSQGEHDCLRWKGLPLFKTVYEFALYPMLLSVLKPGTIFELGSGSGASALWLADMAALAGSPSQVYSVDLQAPAVSHPGVAFVEGDCDAIGDVFDKAFLALAPHPWLVIEDAHANVAGVLAHFDRFTQPGDYLVVEDSGGKQEEITYFLQRHPGRYKVDTHYTDFFGRNATCAQDSIFVRTDD
jgi:cephalosporin hydroxylase